MYSIGEFSLISSMTVKTLRHYHKKGILIPSFVDDDTGYRYYSSKDIDRASVISILKTFQFSLKDIETFLLDMNEDADVIEALKDKKAQIDADIKSLKNVTCAIDSIIYKEQEASTMTNTTTNIEIKVIPEQLVVSTRWQGAYSDTGKAMGKIYRAGGRQSAGPALNLYYDGEHKDIADIESCLPVKKQLKSKLDCRVLPQQQCVCLIHKGPYETLGASYKALFDYMKKNGLTMALPTREIYVKGPGMIFKGNSEKYLTELLIPIA
jgi:effector-binding domain-containing protein